jgi:hypothetical protein
MTSLDFVNVKKSTFCLYGMSVDTKMNEPKWSSIFISNWSVDKLLLFKTLSVIPCLGIYISLWSPNQNTHNFKKLLHHGLISSIMMDK